MTKTSLGKGIEGLPLKYLSMLLVAAVVLVAVVTITTNFTSIATNETKSVMGMLTDFLNTNIANILKRG